jgi:endonuclease-3
MKQNPIKQILSLLTDEYGNREWKLDPDPIAVLIQTILSQNTSDLNSHRAFASLITSFGSWEKILTAGIEQIADSIRFGGLAEVKARYIKQALMEIKHRRGKLSLEFLKRLSVDEARGWLIQIPGVGMKTASCVLLFSLGLSALPVDTHVSRLTRRLGLTDSKIPIDKISKLLESVVPKKDVYVFHVLLIEHGRRVCKAQHPRCSQCILQSICPSYEKLSKLE